MIWSRPLPPSWTQVTLLLAQDHSIPENWPLGGVTLADQPSIDSASRRKSTMATDNRKFGGKAKIAIAFVHVQVADNLAPNMCSRASHRSVSQLLRRTQMNSKPESSRRASRSFSLLLHSLSEMQLGKSCRKALLRIVLAGNKLKKASTSFST